MAPSLCGDSIRSRRSLLAGAWSIVNLLALLSFATAFIVALTAKNSNTNYYNNNNNNENENEEENEQQQEEENDAIISVSSRAMAFAALWTMVISGLLGIFGTILLGFQSPVSGNYFWCCPTKVHTTTPLSLGSFIGALVMFSNLTLVCSVLFGEFQVHDYQREGEQGGNEKDEEYMQESALSRSSLAFAIMCMFLTIIYAGFAGLVFTYADDVLRENYIDSRQEALTPSDPENGRGYIDSNRFGVEGKPTHMTSEGFVSPKQSRSCDTSGPLDSEICH